MFFCWCLVQLVCFCFFPFSRRLARLDKKNDERLTAYYVDFVAMCRRVCGRLTEEDQERTGLE